MYARLLRRVRSTLSCATEGLRWEANGSGLLLVLVLTKRALCPLMLLPMKAAKQAILWIVRSIRSMILSDGKLHYFLIHKLKSLYVWNKQQCQKPGGARMYPRALPPGSPLAAGGQDMCRDSRCT